MKVNYTMNKKDDRLVTASRFWEDTVRKIYVITNMYFFKFKRISPEMCLFCMDLSQYGNKFHLFFSQKSLAFFSN